MRTPWRILKQVLEIMGDAGQQGVKESGAEVFRNVAHCACDRQAITSWDSSGGRSRACLPTAARALSA